MMAVEEGINRWCGNLPRWSHAVYFRLFVYIGYQCGESYVTIMVVRVAIDC